MIASLILGPNLLESELVFIVVLVLLMILLSLVKIKFAWAGLVLCIYGGKKAGRKDQGKTKVEFQQQKEGAAVPKPRRFEMQGTVPYTLVVAGLVVMVLDIWRNGPDAYGEAVDRAQAAGGLAKEAVAAKGDLKQLERNINKELMQRITSLYLQDPLRKFRELATMRRDPKLTEAANEFDNAVAGVVDEDTLVELDYRFKMTARKLHLVPTNDQTVQFAVLRLESAALEASEYWRTHKPH